MKKGLFILLIGSVFFLSACSSNISPSKQEMVKALDKENSKVIDECVQQCSIKKKEQNSSVDCPTVCLRSSAPYQRDQRRVLDIKQIQTAIQLYFNDAKQYPSELTISGSISYKGLSYMLKIPISPLPADGSCTEDNNSYKYQVINEPQTRQSYTLTYCLGGDVDAGFGEIKGGPHTATQKGMY